MNSRNLSSSFIRGASCCVYLAGYHKFIGRRKFKVRQQLKCTLTVVRPLFIKHSPPFRFIGRSCRIEIVKVQQIAKSRAVGRPLSNFCRQTFVLCRKYPFFTCLYLIHLLTFQQAVISNEHTHSDHYVDLRQVKHI